MKSTEGSSASPSASVAAESVLAHEPGRGLIFMLLSLSFFTGNTLLLRYLIGNEALDPWLALLFRAVVGFCITLSLVRTAGLVSWRAMFVERLLVLRGILGILGTVCFYYSIPILGAGLSTMFSNTYVLFGAVAAAVFLREKLTTPRIAWILVAFAGVVLLSQSGSLNINPRFGAGVAIALSGAVFASLTIVVIRKLTATHTTATIFMAQCLYIFAISGPIAILRFQWPGWINLGLLVVAASMAALGQLAMNQGYRFLSVTSGASVQMALPVTAAAGGFILFGEILSGMQILGATLVIVGCWRVATQR